MSVCVFVCVFVGKHLFVAAGVTARVCLAVGRNRQGECMCVFVCVFVGKRLCMQQGGDSEGVPSSRKKKAG